MRIELDYVPQPRQKLLHAAIASELLYGGAAGGGKSHSLRWDAYEFCMKNPGCVAGLVRQTLPQLEANHILPMKRELPKQLGSYNETKKRFDFWNGSVLLFRHCEYDKDLNDFQGIEFHWLGIDEAALLKPEHIQFLKTRLRLGGWMPQDPHAKARLPRLAMTSNPGGPAHLYLKENYIDPAVPEEVFEHITEVNGREIVKTRIFIPATMRDNEYLDEEYEAQFSELQDWKAKQLRDGDWDVIPGAFFDCWDPRTHVIPQFHVPDWWPKFRSCDWGFATPFSVGEWTVSDGTQVVGKDGVPRRYPDGALIRIWEWYGGKGSQGLRMDAQAVASEIIRKRGKVRPGPGDPSMWRSDSGPSHAEKFAKGGLLLFRGDNHREPGWQEMYRRIKAGMLLVTDNCRDFTRTIPTLTADPNNPNDVLKAGEDHVGDETRYACMSRPFKKTEPPPTPDPLAPLRFCDLKVRETEPRRWI